jgi:hypothetical protein
MFILIFDFHFSCSHLPVSYDKNSNLYLYLSGGVIYIFCMRNVRNNDFLLQKKEGKVYKLKTFFFFKYCFTKKQQLFWKQLFLRGFFVIEIFFKKHYPPL